MYESIASSFKAEVPMNRKSAPDNRKSGEGGALLVLFLLGLTVLLIGGITTCSNAISYKKGLGGHITNAAAANSIELAAAEMEKIVSYAEENGYTHGYTSALYNTPDEDLGFWFKNMKSSLAELKELSSGNSTQLEKSNSLLKLHESLSHTPSGIANFPNNSVLAWALVIGVILVFVPVMLLPQLR